MIYGSLNYEDLKRQIKKFLQKFCTFEKPVNSYSQQTFSFKIQVELREESKFGLVSNWTAAGAIQQGTGESLPFTQEYFSSIIPIKSINTTELKLEAYIRQIQ